MKKIILTLTLAILTSLSGVMAQVIVKVRPARPKVVVVKPNKVVKNKVWIEGHWKWNRQTRNYTWVKGHWVRKRPGQRWIAGRWKKVPAGWKYMPGHWVRG